MDRSVGHSPIYQALLPLGWFQTDPFIGEHRWNTLLCNLYIYEAFSHGGFILAVQLGEVSGAPCLFRLKRESIVVSVKKVKNF
jgi:hypothetical protein